MLCCVQNSGIPTSRSDARSLQLKILRLCFDIKRSRSKRLCSQLTMCVELQKSRVYKDVELFNFKWAQQCEVQQTATAKDRVPSLRDVCVSVLNWQLYLRNWDRRFVGFTLIIGKQRDEARVSCPYFVKASLSTEIIDNVLLIALVSFPVRPPFCCALIWRRISNWRSGFRQHMQEMFLFGGWSFFSFFFKCIIALFGMLCSLN